MASKKARKARQPSVWYPTPDATDIGNRIRERREAKGWSLSELSSDAEIPYNTLWAYERRSRVPRLQNLVRIAVALRFPSIDVLLFGAPRVKWKRLRRRDERTGRAGRVRDPKSRPGAPARPPT